MDLTSLPTEIILSPSHTSLGHQSFDWTPQPGGYLEIAGQTYLILERRHRYQLKSGRYQLHQIALYVKAAPVPLERSLHQRRWVIGDVRCRFNARSEILRCAINPTGPCNACTHYQPLENQPLEISPEAD